MVSTEAVVIRKYRFILTFIVSYFSIQPHWSCLRSLNRDIEELIQRHCFRRD
jgi:hypothetical protein